MDDEGSDDRMTDGIHGGAGPDGPRRDWDPEGLVLRSALHTAVGEIRRVLRDSSPELRSSPEFGRFLSRIAGHDVSVSVRDGMFDVPIALSPPPNIAKDWVARTLLHGILRGLALDEELARLLGSAAGPDPDAADDIAERAELLGDPDIWRVCVAQPLLRVEELWQSAWRAALRREADAPILLGRLGTVLPGAGPMPFEPQTPSAGLDLLRIRIADGDIAWDDCESPPAFSPPAGELGLEPGMVNPWLVLGTTSPENLEPGMLERAATFLWDWARRLWQGLHDCVVDGLMPVAASIYWEAVARSLALLAPSPASEKDSGAPAEGSAPAPAPAPQRGADADAEPPKAVGERTPAEPTAADTASPMAADTVPLPPLGGPPARILVPAPPRRPATPLSQAPAARPVSVITAAGNRPSSPLAAPDRAAMRADAQHALGTIARSLSPVSQVATAARRRAANQTK